MLFAYVIENVSRIYEINNQPIFQLVRDCHLKEDRIFIDRMGADRVEFRELQATVEKGDAVMIRSIVDLADTAYDIVQALEWFGERGIEIVSAEEQEYDYVKNHNLVVDIVCMCCELTEKKRRLGIEKAKAEGRMGRKCNRDKREKVLKLKSAGFVRDEILKMCEISYSTYYRYIKNEIN